MNIFKIFFVFFMISGCTGGPHLVITQGPPPVKKDGGLYRDDGDRTLLYIGLEKTTNYGNCSIAVVETKKGWRDSRGWGNYRLSSRLNGLRISQKKFNSEQAQILIEPGFYELTMVIKNHRTGRQKSVRKTIHVIGRRSYQTIEVWTDSFCRQKHHHRDRWWHDDGYYHHHRPWKDDEYKKKKKRKKKKNKNKKKEKKAKEWLLRDMRRRGMID
jgi:hypothetical protein